MNFKTTTVLLVLLLIVGGYITYLRVSDVATSPVKPDAAIRLLPSLTAAEVTALSLAVEGGDSFGLTNDGSGAWRLFESAAATRPAAGGGSVSEGGSGGGVPADNGAVVSYLNRLLAAESKGTPSGVTVTPAVTVRFEVAGKPYVLAVAAPNAVGESLARLEAGGSSTTHLVGGDLFDALRRDAASFRDLRLVAASQADLQVITLQQPDGWTRLVRAAARPASDAPGLATESAGWTLESGPGTAPDLTADYKPGALRADDSAVRDLLFALTGLRAAEYPPASATSDAFAVAPLTVRFTTVAPTTQPNTPAPRETVVRFGRFQDARRERVLVRVNDAPVAAVPGFALTSLRKSSLDLRDRRVLDLRPADVTRIEIVNTAAGTPSIVDPAAPATAPSTTASAPATGGSASVLITRNPPPTPLVTTAPTTPSYSVNGTPADPAKVESLLESFRPLRATRFLSGEAATRPSTPWRVTLTTESEGTTATHTLDVGDAAARLGDLVFEIPADLADLLKGPFDRTPPPTPTTEPASQP